MDTLKVNTIYPAFMGEVNIHGIGTPCTFVRLAGCNLRCYLKTKGILCDTPEALDMKCGKDMSVSEIVEQVRHFNREVVCLTGGEPLMQNVEKLLVELSDSGYYVVVETNGSMCISPYRHIRNVSFVVDVKSGSSGESEKMIEENYDILDGNDFLKFVVDDEDDLAECLRWISARDYLDCNIAVGTFWGSKLSYETLMKRIMSYAICVPIYLNMQTHKMACLYDRTRNTDSFSDLIIPREL